MTLGAKLLGLFLHILELGAFVARKLHRSERLLDLGDIVLALAGKGGAESIAKPQKASD